MKLQKLADSALKSMVKSYSETEKEIFSIDYFRQQFPEETDSHLSNALYVLQSDGFVKVTPADDIAYAVSLIPSGIRNCQEDTLLKKGYSLIKEIKSLIN